MPIKNLTLTAMMISDAIEKLAPQKTQRELAKEMGFMRANMLSMLKTGDAKVPFAKIPIVAEVLGIDPARLLRTHLWETWPQFADVVFEIFGGILTASEREWLEFFAEAGMLSPPVDSDRRRKLAELMAKTDWEEGE